MSTAAIRGVVRRLGAPADPPTDADLVAAFAARRDPDAFAALVERHGPTVFGACRRVLGHAHDAEDAFQAVFLVLARRVKSIRPPGAIGGWLYGVAVRTANKAKTAAARRRRREMIAASRQANRVSAEPESTPEHAELQAALDEELARLPDILRAVVVLCDLHGKTRAEAAVELGCPDGTVAARLHRARKKLAAALARRGLALPVAGIASVLTPAAVSAAASRSVIAAALGSASPAVMALAREVTRSMTASSHAIAIGTVALLAGGLLAAGSMWPGHSPAQPITPRADITVEEPTSKQPAGPWKETKVLDQDGWLAGSTVYSTDGKMLFVGGTDGHVRAYDAKTWKQLWDNEGKGRFAALAVATDGKTIAATFQDGPASGLRFLDASTGKAGDTLEEQHALKDWPAPLAVAFFPEADVVNRAGELVSTTRKVIFGNCREYVVKTWLVGGKPSTIKSSLVAAGKEPADAYAVPLAADPTGRRVVVTGPVDPATGKNVLWAWSAGSGAGNHLLEGHKEVVVAAAWSKDGKTIVTGDAAGVVITWDAATFKEQSRLALGGRVVAVAITADGKHMAASTARDLAQPVLGAYAEEVFVWKAASPPAKPEPISKHEVGAPFKGVASLAFSPDSRSLVSAYCNFLHLARFGELTGKVRVFSLASEQPKPGEKPGYVTDVQYSPDGKHYAVSPGVTVHDATGRTLYKVTGEAAGFSADGKTLFVMGKKVIECDAETGKVLKEHPRPKTNLAWHLVSFSPDGKQYAAHFGFNIRVFDTATGFEPIRLDNQHEPGSSAFPGTTGKQILWSPDGKQVVAVGVLIDAGKIGATGWDIETGKRQYAFAADFEDGPRAAAFSSNSKSVAIGYEKRIDVWTGGLKPAKNLGEQGLVTALAYSPDGKTIAAGIRLPILHGGDKTPRVIGHKTEVRLIEIATDKVAKVFDGFEGVSHMAATVLPVTALAFSPDGKKLIAGTGIVPLSQVPADAPKTGELKIFELTEQKEPAPVAQKWTDAAVLTDHGAMVNGVAFAPDGKTFAAAIDADKVVIWDATTRKVATTINIKDAERQVFGLSYRHDGKVLAVTNRNSFGLYDPAKGGSADVAGQKSWSGQYTAIAYAPDGKRLAMSDGYTTRMVEPGTENRGTYGGPTPKDAKPAPAGVAWSPDGKWIAAIHPRNEAGGPFGPEAERHWPVTLWSVEAKDPVRSLLGHDEPVTAVAWSKDGKLIASGDLKGTVIAWDAESGKELWRKRYGDGAGRVHAVAISPEDNTIAVGIGLGARKSPERVVLLAGKDGAEVQHLLRDGIIPFASVAWSRDGKFLLTGCGSAGRPVEQDEPPTGAVVIWERKPK